VKKSVLLPLLLSFALSLPVWSQSATAGYAQGRAAQLSGDNFKAIELYKTALELNPSYVQPMIGLSETYFALGEFQEALKYAQEAERFDLNNATILDLEGRARIGLGDFSGAAKIFNQVLSTQPNNVEAKFGLAELEIASGEPKSAAASFENALSIAPENRRALLSLILLYDSLGNMARAEQYTKLALQYHPDDALTHYIAAKHYLHAGDLADAQAQVETSLELNPQSVNATLLLSEVYQRTGQYAKVVPLVKTILSKNSRDYLLWYSLGLAYEQLGRTDDSIQSFARAFAVRPDDEVSRIALESEVISKLDMKDPRRAKYADYHFAKGQAFQERYYMDRAMREYRRGLKIDPYSKSGRLLYANAYQTLGFPAMYLSQLEVLQKLGKSDTDIADSIDIQSSALSDSVSATWGIDQFTLSREPYTVSLFYTTSGSMIHYLGQQFLAGYVHDTLESTENVSLSGTPSAVGSFADAFRQARDTGSDYFVILSFNESERYFRVTADLYVSATGTRVATEQSYRTGNDRVADALVAVSDSIDSLLPLRGRLVNRKFDTGLIDIGSVDGAKVGDKLLIVKNGSISLAQDRIGFSYPQTAVVGDFQITRTDALVSEGTVTKNQFFDLINPEDWVIYPPPKGTPPQAQQPPPGELYQSFLAIPGG
jgi:tetratricopeptide (TPR) repeat protein